MCAEKNKYGVIIFYPVFPMDLSEGVDAMQGAIANLKNELGKIRAGRANPDVVEGVEVEAYGSKMPISHVATISVPDPRTIVVQPWDDSVVKSIEKALQSANLGMTPIADGKVIRMTIPQLTAELREEFVKTMKDKVEDTRVAVRGIRHKIMESVEQQAKDMGVSEDDVKRRKDEVEKEVQKIMDEVEAIAEAKEKELISV
jgi:ribosome recycling factor